VGRILIMSTRHVAGFEIEFWGKVIFFFWIVTLGVFTSESGVEVSLTTSEVSFIVIRSFQKYLWGWSQYQRKNPVLKLSANDFASLNRGAQIFQKKKSRSHLEILGGKVTWNKFHTKDSQILGATVHKFNGQGDLAPGICAFLVRIYNLLMWKCFWK